MKNEAITFTDSELQVLQLICQDIPAHEIAIKVHLAKRSVDGIRLRLYRKVGSNGLAGLVQYASEHGLIRSFVETGESKIHPTSIIYPNVTIGKNVEIGPYCIIGAPAENLKTWGNKGHGVIIGDDVRITGHVTIDEGVEMPTMITDGCFIMKGVHIGHDVFIGTGVIISPHCIVGGHVFVYDGCNLGMGTIIRNRKEIPANVQIGMGSIVTRSCELWSGAIFAGNPCTHIKDK